MARTVDLDHSPNEARHDDESGVFVVVSAAEFERAVARANPEAVSARSAARAPSGARGRTPRPRTTAPSAAS